MTADDYSGLTDAGDGTDGSLFPGSHPGGPRRPSRSGGRARRPLALVEADQTAEASGQTPPEAGLREADPDAVARSIVLRQLTGSPKSRRQLADKLSAREVPADSAERVLDRFEELQLVDDAAFADAWVRSRTRSRGLSRSVLQRELRDKGIDEELIASVLEQVSDDDELAMARELVQKKARTLPAGLDHDKGVRRLVAMLGRKGYGPGIAFRVVREVWPADEE